ncbi:hypothetical protein ACFP9V_21490 [Deinococcus radiopugnans]
MTQELTVQVAGRSTGTLDVSVTGLPTGTAPGVTVTIHPESCIA